MKASITLARDFVRGTIEDALYGSFIEHLGRCVHGGIYEQGHPSADANGFRRDVIELIKELRVPVIRYPGGNYTSSYDWIDSVGPREERRVRIDLAWRSLQPNTFGLAEFMDWLKEVDAAPLMTLNMGTQGVAEAVDLLEYCNFPGGTYWSDLRRTHGHRDPFGIKLWCLGNEIDGPWQVGQKSPAEYARLANETAKAMKLLDPSIKVCVCGSSFRKMPTFPEWEHTVLDLCYDTVDFLSLHTYLRNEHKDRATYLAESMEMEAYIEIALEVCDTARGKKRSPKTMPISFDEWNVWPRAQESDRDLDPWKVGPHLLEETYTMEDALAFGCMVNVLLRHADRIRMACQSMLVNVMAPIMTENRGPAWKQTIFFPYQLAMLYGTGVALEAKTASPTYENRVYGQVPCVDTAATYDASRREVVIFAINRSEKESVELTSVARGFGAVKNVEHLSLFSDDPGRANTRERPDAIVPRTIAGGRVTGETTEVRLPPFSWNMLRLKV